MTMPPRPSRYKVWRLSPLPSRTVFELRARSISSLDSGLSPALVRGWCLGFVSGLLSSS